ncbi:MAG: hypothetical protein HQL72_12160 [Magnetococcales bacterium]|nr:hypothetical protein [Magnetococcales bacterium]
MNSLATVHQLPHRPFTLSQAKRRTPSPRNHNLTNTTIHYLVQATNQLETIREKAKDHPMADELTMASDNLQNGLTALGVILAGREV